MSGLFKQVLSLQAFVGVDHEAEPMASGLAGFDERLVSQPNLLEERGDDLIAFRILSARALVSSKAFVSRTTSRSLSMSAFHKGMSVASKRIFSGAIGWISPYNTSCKPTCIPSG